MFLREAHDYATYLQTHMSWNERYPFDWDRPRQGEARIHHTGSSGMWNHLVVFSDGLTGMVRNRDIDTFLAQANLRRIE